MIGNKRASFVNYRKPGIFMISFNSLPVAGVLSEICVKGAEPNPDVFAVPNERGRIIRSYLKDFTRVCPDSEVLKSVIMPDHIHFIIYVKREIPMPLGNYMAKFKRQIYND